MVKLTSRAEKPAGARSSRRYPHSGVTPDFLSAPKSVFRHPVGTKRETDLSETISFSSRNWPETGQVYPAIVGECGFNI
jgi:hypothetical protein